MYVLHLHGQCRRTLRERSAHNINKNLGWWWQRYMRNERLKKKIVHRITTAWNNCALQTNQTSETVLRVREHARASTHNPIRSARSGIIIEPQPLGREMCYKEQIVGNYDNGISIEKEETAMDQLCVCVWLCRYDVKVALAGTPLKYPPTTKWIERRGWKISKRENRCRWKTVRLYDLHHQKWTAHKFSKRIKTNRMEQQLQKIGPACSGYLCLCVSVLGANRGWLWICGWLCCSCVLYEFFSSTILYND